MEAIKGYWDDFSKIKVRQKVLQGAGLGMVLSAALVIYKIAMLVTNSQSPIVVVLSESMEPGIRRGDLLFLTNWNSPFEVGEIVVYKIPGREIPIVHRITKVHANGLPDTKMLTKGDNNYVDDVSLYAPGEDWLRSKNIVGRCYLMLPYTGMLTILMNDYPPFKYLLLGSLSLFALINEE